MRLKIALLALDVLDVSIPGGFSGSLRHLPSPRPMSCPMMFQSLAGFLARCDDCPGSRIERLVSVSIPGGFSGSLRLHGGDGLHLARSVVSIPGGFSGSLRLSGQLLLSAPWIGFNPWRVFWLVATAVLYLWTMQAALFQSLAGFLARCDALIQPPNGPKHMSFNPWRVFWLVATLCRKINSGHQICFNPWRVFWLVATYRCIAACGDAGYFVSIPGGFSGSLRP